MATKYTQALNIRFVDDDRHEAVRKNTDTRITELQNQLAGGTSGTVLKRLVLTGSGVTTLPTGTTVVDVEMVGGGGGGGGGQGGAGVGVAGGGASGVYLAFSVDLTGISNLRASWSCGAGGAGGSNIGGNGGTGGDTVLSLGGKTYTAKGSGGGTGQTNVAGVSAAIGGLPGVGSSPGDRVGGTEGDHAVNVGGIFFSGGGGDNPMGPGGPSVDGGQPGKAGLGPGAGGSGGNATVTGQPGGAGVAGRIILVARS